MTGSARASATNPAERVAGQEFRQWRACLTCGEPVIGGTRGPLPHRHRDCEPPGKALLYQIRAAAKLAHSIGRETIGRELDALAAVIQVDLSPTPRQPAAPGTPAAEWTRFGE